MGRESAKSPDDSRPFDHKALLAWYRANRRSLPWRENRDPYRIWISEVMLQQTTVAAVIPYYERFLKSFPDVKTLAEAPEGDVLRAWAGLGYYSRARNLHKASKALAAGGFPRTAAELIELPGFGPYTSAAVASIAFGDEVGVLDGNVIRVLCRRYGLDIPWWNNAEKKMLQAFADAFARLGRPDEINQALMELGATVCTPSSPSCLLCPWSSVCEARRQDKVSSLPRPKPRRALETWVWSPIVTIKNERVALVQNSQGPVLKGQWIFPGDFRPSDVKPKKFAARHGITHHDLYVCWPEDKGRWKPDPETKWVPLKDLESVTPSKLLRKVLQAAEGQKP
ncbi:MAG: A/G-specific adenine glycosylase [Bdellovibrionaceae bacterium]|nr:A/G-specific adenine glycosylase [Pseudobdellovibrionaceae bacterium]